MSFLGGSGVSIKGVKIVRDTPPENNIQGHYSRTPQSNPENILKVYLPLSKHQLVINQLPLKIISWKIKFPCWALTIFNCELLALGRFVFYILGHMNITHTDIESFTFESDYNSVFYVCWEFCLFCLMQINNTCRNMIDYT